MSLIPGEETTESSTTETQPTEGGEQQTEQPQTTTEGIPETAEGEQSTEDAWLFADGVLGEGEKPEWFKDSKYKTIADQAKAYTEAEKRLGSFIGAPKDGKYKLEGVDFDDNPLMKVVADWGIDNQLSEDGLKGLVGKVNELAEAQIEEDKKTALEDLGANAEKRLSDLATWGKNNLEPDEFEAYQGLAQNANHVAVLEKIIGMSKNAKLVSDDVTVPMRSPKQKDAELREMQIKTNDKGQRLIDVDPEYRKEFERQMAEFYNKK